MKFNKNKICAAALAGAMALSALSVGFAQWQTDIAASSNVTAKAKWDVVVTDADINLSNGTTFSGAEANYELIAAEMDSDPVANLSSDKWVDDEELIGTQTGEELSDTLHYYAIDKTKYDITDMTKLDRSTIIADKNTITISNELKKYYRYVNGMYENQDYYYELYGSMVLEGFLRDTAALLQKRYPDTYQNYAVVSLVGIPAWYYTIAEFENMSEAPAKATISEDKTSVTYANITFGLPGAWAQYSLTIANNGTVDANLADAVIELKTESDQLSLKTPDLKNEVLKAGESCEIKFNVYVPAAVEEDLDATGTLTVKLPYSQATVDKMPEVEHVHSVETN